MDKKDVTVYVRMDKELALAIDHYRRNQEVIPSVSEALRELVKAGLKTKDIAAPK